MLQILGERQRELIQLLRDHPAGMTMDDLAVELDIARTAVRQHLTALERDGYIEPGETRRTAGRPVRLFRLSTAAEALFPKQYAWFSTLLLQALRQERGSDGLSRWMGDLAATVAAGLPVDPAGALAEHGAALAKVMNGLGYEAGVTASDDPETVTIEARNCVYHDLAVAFPEVCQFDRSLMATVTGGTVDHQTCMANGEQTCRFVIAKPSS